MRLVAVIAALLAACAPSPALDQPGELSVAARPLPLSTADPALARVGRLRWLGGLELDSTNERWGGLSGLRWISGELWSVSDQGDLFRFEPIERNNRLTGIGPVRVERLTAKDGRPLTEKAESDAEALEVGIAGDFYIAFERLNVVRGYAPETDGARITNDSLGEAMAGWPINGGPEAYACTPSERCFVLAEEAPGLRGGVAGLIAGDSSGRFSYLAPPPFQPTDAVALDEQRLLVLHRHFTPADGVSAALSLVDLADVREGAVVTGDVLATLRPPLSVDNMEGLAVRREGGRTFVYLSSDDNFSSRQRTLLMKFELVG